MAGPFLSVIIPTYNRRESLGPVLHLLSAQTLPVREFEVIVVDDGSTDGTPDFLRQASFPFTLTAVAVSHGGPGRARNAGAGKARGTYLAFLEDDVEPDAHFLERAAEKLREGRIDVLEGETLDLESKRPLRRYETGDQLSFIPCNLFVRKELFDRIGGYDGEFYDGGRRLYFREDADLGFRMLDAGAVVAKAADVNVSHPRQFNRAGDCLRHARRYQFDALLWKKHPERFREYIEVKRIFGIRIRRPQHILALAHCLASVGVFVAVVAEWWSMALALALFLVLSTILLRYKYQGSGALRLFELKEMAGFFLWPYVYLGSVWRGCRRYGGYGVLL